MPENPILIVAFAVASSTLEKKLLKYGNSYVRTFEILNTEMMMAIYVYVRYKVSSPL